MAGAVGLDVEHVDETGRQPSGPQNFADGLQPRAAGRSKDAELVLDGQRVSAGWRDTARGIPACDVGDGTDRADESSRCCDSPGR